jgi:P-type Ca2+ transporter type 2C
VQRRLAWKRTNEPGGFSTVGDPTEGALVIAAARAGLWKQELDHAFPRVAEVPFDSDRKRMTTVHRPIAEKVPDLLDPFEDERPDFFSPDHNLVITKGRGRQPAGGCEWVWCAEKPKP